MTYEIEAMKQLVLRLNKEQKMTLLEISKMQEGRLYQEMNDGRTFYYQRIWKGREKTRRGITKNQKLIYQLARKEYLLTKLKNQEKGIKWLKQVSPKLDFCDWQNTLREVSKRFPMIPLAAFLLGDKYEPHSAGKNTMFSEGTIHRTQLGIMVRSKSELIIADMLESLGIPYQYEVELPYETYQFCPDFTIIRPRDGKVIFWEHFGLTHDEEYLKKMDTKLQTYRNMNIRPWTNLMISYDREDGSVDIGVIRGLVEGWLQ